VAKITHIYSRAARRGMADTAADAAAAASASSSGAVGDTEMDEGSEGHTAAVQVRVRLLTLAYVFLQVQIKSCFHRALTVSIRLQAVF
jgi:hypothetical protein